MNLLNYLPLTKLFFSQNCVSGYGDWIGLQKAHFENDEHPGGAESDEDHEDHVAAERGEDEEDQSHMVGDRATEDHKKYADTLDGGG